MRTAKWEYTADEATVRRLNTRRHGPGAKVIKRICLPMPRRAVRKVAAGKKTVSLRLRILVPPDTPFPSSDQVFVRAYPQNEAPFTFGREDLEGKQKEEWDDWVGWVDSVRSDRLGHTTSTSRRPELDPASAAAPEQPSTRPRFSFSKLP